MKSYRTVCIDPITSSARTPTSGGGPTWQIYRDANQPRLVGHSAYARER